MQYFLIVLSTLFVAGQFTFNKMYQKYVVKSTAALLLFPVLTGIIAVALFLSLNGFSLAFGAFSFGIAVGEAIVLTLCMLCGIFVVKFGRVSVYTVFMMLGGMLLPFIYGLIFLGEPLSVFKIIGILVLVAGLIGIRAYMRTQTDIETIVNYGITYLNICILCSFGVFVEITFERFLQATGRTVYSMVTQLVGAITNIILDPILIFGLLGFPKMGIAGAAWATVIGQCLGAVVAVILNHCKNPEIHLRLRHIRPSGKLMGEITAISIPSIIMSCISSLTCFVMNLILITFSSTAVAVFGVYFKLQSFVFMPVFGLNNGMVPIIAYNYGAQKPERIHKTIRLGMVYAVAIMVIGLLVFQLIPKELLLMFDASDAMLEIGAPALRIMSLAFIFAGISIVAGSSCQAFGYSVYSMLISIARQIVVLIPAAYLLSLTGVLRSIWFAFPIAEIFSLILSLFFLRTTLKKTGMAMPKTK